MNVPETLRRLGIVPKRSRGQNFLIDDAAAATIGSWLPAAAPLAGAAWRPAPGEGVVVALALAGGILAACWPAWRASRLDVAATLADA